MKFDFSKIKDFNKAMLEHSWVRALMEWSKRHSLPGFFNVPIYDVGVFLINEIRRFALVTRANSMAFSFFLALFPSIIFLFSLATHFPIYETFHDEINGFIDKVMQGESGDWLKDTIPVILSRNTEVLSLGFFFAIFFASNGLLSMMRSFEKSHIEASFKKRAPWKKRLIAVGLTFQIGILLIISVFLIILGKLFINRVADMVNLAESAIYIINVFRWLVILALIYFGIALIYRYGAPTIKKFGFVTPGTTLAAILSILSSLAFSFYTSHYGRYNQVYGPVAAIIVLMLWIQINSFILLVGFELNASIAVNRDLKKRVENDEDD